MIIGYGFSLFRNSADFCSLHISSEIKQRIATIKQLGSTSKNLETVNTGNKMTSENRPPNNLAPNLKIIDLETPLSEDLGQKMVSGGANRSNSDQLAQSLNQNLQWVCLKPIILGGNLDHDQTSYKFSPGFLADSSIAFANKREITEFNFDLKSCVDFSSTRFSRNKLHVLSAVAMILQKQQMAITKHDSNLPPWPQNEKQFHAARYRRNQLQILESVIESLLGSLGNLAGLRNPTSRAIAFVRLEIILTEPSQGFLTDFRAILNAGLGTRNAAKIRKNCWVECVFTLWLCGLSLWHQHNAQANSSSFGSSFSSKILQWLGFLRHFYGTPTKIESSSKPIHRDLHRVRISDGSDDETRLLCTSFLAVIQTAILKNPHSLYGSSDVTVNDLEWCLNIIREEGVMCPNLEGKAGEEYDEFVLFLDDAEN